MISTVVSSFGGPGVYDSEVNVPCRPCLRTDELLSRCLMVNALGLTDADAMNRGTLTDIIRTMFLTTDDPKILQERGVGIDKTGIDNYIDIGGSVCHVLVFVQ